MITLKEILTMIAAVFIGALSYVLLAACAIPAWIIVLVALIAGGSVSLIFLRV